MSKYTRNYFTNRPDVVKIFDDLDSFRDFCKMEMLPFNEADLYNQHSRVWQRYDAVIAKPAVKAQETKPTQAQKYRQRYNRNN